MSEEMEMETREILVFGEKTFKIKVPKDAKLTFGPWSPPPKERGGGWDHADRRGTLRVYQGTEKNILAVFAGVSGFRDTTLEYMEEVVREEGATIWKSDEKGYMRESKSAAHREWVGELPPAEVRFDMPNGDDDVAL